MPRSCLPMLTVWLCFLFFLAFHLWCSPRETSSVLLCSRILLVDRYFPILAWFSSWTLHCNLDAIHNAKKCNRSVLHGLLNRPRIPSCRNCCHRQCFCAFRVCFLTTNCLLNSFYTMINTLRLLCTVSQRISRESHLYR